MNIRDGFLEEIIDLIEGYEFKIESEWGCNRRIGELIDSGEMPEIYYEAVMLLNEQTENPSDKNGRFAQS